MRLRKRSPSSPPFQPRPRTICEIVWLSSGIVRAEPPGPAPRVEAARVAQAFAAAAPPAAGIEVRFVPDYRVADGRHYENAWLQEFPDPVTKLTWENAAHLSPATAAPTAS